MDLIVVFFYACLLIDQFHFVVGKVKLCLNRGNVTVIYFLLFFLNFCVI